MTRLIKSDDAISAVVRTFPAVDQETARPTADATSGLRVRLEESLGQLVQRDAEIERLGGEVSRAFEEGKAIGREAGLREADGRHADALARLDKGIEQALDRFAAELAALERLAMVVAREALEKILGDAGNYGDLVGRIIKDQTEKLHGHAVLKVTVSREDFADPVSVAALADATNRAGIEVRASDELKAGGCRIQLSLGALEVGVGQQWDRLSALLDNAAAPAKIR